MLHKVSPTLAIGARRDFPDSDLHGERRMENDNYRYPRQNGREDNFRGQSLHDYPDIPAAHNRRCEGKRKCFYAEKKSRRSNTREKYSKLRKTVKLHKSLNIIKSILQKKNAPDSLERTYD